MIENSRYIGGLFLKKAWEQTLSQQEAAALKDSLEKWPHLEPLITQFADTTWVKAEIEAMQQYRKEKVWGYIQERLPKKEVQMLYYWLYAKAAVILLGAIYLIWLAIPHSHLKNQSFSPISAIGGATMTSSPDTPRNAVLPDSSHIILAGNSQLSLSASFGKGKREICLQGQAFLDVKGDASNPFIVHLHNSTIEVLGTQFYVRAYEKDSGDVITLFSGSVGLRIGDSIQLVKCYRQVWIRHDSIRILPPDSTITIGGTSENPCWIFHNTSLAATLQWIADWHQVNISNPGHIIGSGIKDSCFMQDKLEKTVKEIQGAQWGKANLRLRKGTIYISSRP